MSKIQQELALATGVNLARDEDLADVGYLKRLIKAVADLSDDAWAKVGKPAQSWFNEAADNANKKKSIPGFPDVEVAEEPNTRRRRSAEDEPHHTTAEAYTPKKGDEVRVVTARGTAVVGVVTMPDDDGELVLLVGTGKDAEEVGFKLAKLTSIELADPPAPARGVSRRKADDDGPADMPQDPGLGDTVEIENARGVKKLGNITEMDDETVTIVDSSGELTDYTRSKIKSIMIKVTASAGGRNGHKKEEPADAERQSNGARTKAGADAGGKPDETKTRATKDENGGVSVTLRAREMMCDDPLNPLSLEELSKAMKGEKLVFNDNTLKMVHADCVKMFALLKTAKHLK